MAPCVGLPRPCSVVSGSMPSSASRAGLHRLWRRRFPVAPTAALQQDAQQPPSAPKLPRTKLREIPDSAHVSLLGLDATNTPRPPVTRLEVQAEADTDAELRRSVQADA